MPTIHTYTKIAFNSDINSITDEVLVNLPSGGYTIEEEHKTSVVVRIMTSLLDILDDMNIPYTELVNVVTEDLLQDLLQDISEFKKEVRDLRDENDELLNLEHWIIKPKRLKVIS